MNKAIILAILGLLGIGIPVAYTAGPFTSKVEVGDCTVSGDFVRGYTATGTRDCGTPAGGGSPANPTATAGPTAVNGSASTYMRSDGAPAVQQGSASQKGIVQVDGTSITAASGVISATGASGANPSATASDTAVNGSATTFMRSDAAPAVQKATSGQFGVVEVDGSTITATSGVISATSTSSTGANPSATAGPTAVNGSASTFMRSDGAPAVQKATSGQFGIVEVDGTTITASGGVISAVDGTTFANPTATASDAAVNGVATTAMRSDAAPAVQKATSGQFGVVEVDGSTITATGGVISSVSASGANPSATAGPTAVNGSAATFMRSDGAPAVQQGSAAQKGIVQVDGTSITASSGVISATGVSGANPTATAKDTVVNGSATTYMRSDGAPAIQKATSGQFGLVEVDGTTITASGGVITAAAGTGVLGANPTATAGPTAINGSATTYLRSDGAPAVQLGTGAQKGIVQCDGTTITCTAGVITATAIVKSNAPIGWVATTNPDQTVVITASSAMTITAVRGTVVAGVGATATIQPYKTASGTACSGGTALTTGTFNANGTANTNQTLTLAGAGAPSMVTDDRICLSTGNGAAFAAGTGNGGITFEYTVP